MGDKGCNTHRPWKLPCKCKLQRLLKNYSTLGWQSQQRLAKRLNYSLSHGCSGTAQGGGHIWLQTKGILGRHILVCPFSLPPSFIQHLSVPRVSKPRGGPSSGFPPLPQLMLQIPATQSQSSWTHFYGNNYNSFSPSPQPPSKTLECQTSYRYFSAHFGK